MGRRVRLQHDATRVAATPVVVTRVAPRYIICAMCKGPKRRVFYRKQDWAEHVLARHPKKGNDPK